MLIAMTPLATVVPAGPAVADYGVSCAASIGNTFRGYRIQGSRDGAGQTYRGVSSVVSVRRSRICDPGTGTPTFNAAFSMLSGTSLNSGGKLGWAQVGYMKNSLYSAGNFPVYHFSEYYNPGTNSYSRDVMTRYGTLPATGETHHYFVQWSPSRGCVELDIDVTFTGCTSWSPFSVWAQPFNLEWNGESGQYAGTDIPGYASTKATFSDMRVQDSSNFFVANIPVPIVASTPTQARFADSGYPLGRTFSIWTAS